MRQIVLDTETTGLDPQQGHRVIEIGCVEIENRKLTGNHYHCYLNPDRDIDEAAVEVHGITSQFLADKPRFKKVEQEFLDFVKGAELVIHNAPFDIGFLNAELKRVNSKVESMGAICSVLDTLQLAREKHPGQRNNLDALCKRYGIDNTQRDLHGALLDAEILADVYLTMTSGQSSLSLREEPSHDSGANQQIREIDPNRPPLAIRTATAEELKLHEQRLAAIDSSSENGCLWLQLDNDSDNGDAAATAGD
ncbi:MAG: DNA polymerase III subunit epsilon [Gammaproteobacteria bacterium]